MDRLFSRTAVIRPAGVSEISGWLADSSAVASAYSNRHGVAVSTAKDAGSARRSSAAAAKPSTRPLSPPMSAERRQCSNCRVGTGSRYGLSVCGAISLLVNARFAGSATTRTSNSRP